MGSVNSECCRVMVVAIPGIAQRSLTAEGLILRRGSLRCVLLQVLHSVTLSVEWSAKEGHRSAGCNQNKRLKKIKGLKK